MVKRRNKWILSFISVLFVVLFGLVIYSPKTKAFDYKDAGNIGYTSASRLNGTTFSITPNVFLEGMFFGSFNTNQGEITSLSMCLDGTIPANSVWHFNLQIQDLTQYQIRYPMPMISSNNGNYSIIEQTYGEYGQNSYVLYADVNLTGCLSFRFPPMNASISQMFVNVGRINYVTLSNSPTQEQMQQIVNVVQSNNNKMDEVLQELKKQSDKEEQQQQEQEQQGTDGQNDASQAGQDVESSTTNLLSAITGFFGAFTSATATTCQTDWGIDGFRNFDFCATQIPTELRVVFTIVASIIFVPMIWFLITSILNAFKEFQQ